MYKYKNIIKQDTFQKVLGLNWSRGGSMGDVVTQLKMWWLI